MFGQLVGGQIDPPSLQVFVDVAQKVGELERLSQCGGVGRGLFASRHRAEDGQHLKADHFC